VKKTGGGEELSQQNLHVVTLYVGLQLSLAIHHGKSQQGVGALTCWLLQTGNQATIQYQQTMTFIKPLYKQLKQKLVHPEMVAGLYMIVQAIKQRNYLHAYDVYMRLAIGEPQSLQPLCNSTERLLSCIPSLSMQCCMYDMKGIQSLGQR
jgi:hypothetical protein